MTILGPSGVKPDLAGERKALILIMGSSFEKPKLAEISMRTSRENCQAEICIFVLLLLLLFAAAWNHSVFLLLSAVTRWYLLLGTQNDSKIVLKSTKIGSWGSLGTPRAQLSPNFDEQGPFWAHFGSPGGPKIDQKSQLALKILIWKRMLHRVLCPCCFE